MPSVKFLAVLTLLALTHPAVAASRGYQSSSETLKSALIGFVPVAVFLLILYFLLRSRLKSPLAQRQLEYLERNTAHMERMEELLERATVALEAAARKEPPVPSKQA